MDLPGRNAGELPPTWRRVLRGISLGTGLRESFPLPSLEGDRRRRGVAVLLHRALVAYALGGVVFVLVHLLRGDLAPRVGPVLLGSILVSAWALHRLARGRLGQAAAVALFANWSATTTALVALGTIRAPAFIFYLLGIHVAGLVFGSRGLVAMAGLCSATVAALAAAESGGLVAPVDLSASAVNWTTATLALFAVGVLTLAHFETTRAALEQARREVDERRSAERELIRLNRELSSAIEHVRTLEDLVSACAWCRRIRDEAGTWHQREDYLADRTGAAFANEFCPDCAARDKA